MFLKKQMKKKGRKYSVKKAFEFFDTDNNHYLEKHDFVDALDVLKLTSNMKESEIDDLVSYFDSDGDGMGDNPMGIGADKFPNDSTQWGDIDGGTY